MQIIDKLLRTINQFKKVLVNNVLQSEIEK